MHSFRKLIVVAVALAVCWLPATASAQASRSDVQYDRARILAVIKQQGTSDKARLVMLGGDQKGKTLTANIGAVTSSLDVSPPKYQKGDIVMVSTANNSDGSKVSVIIDHYRLSKAAWLLAGILLLAIAFAGWRGIGSILGLILSVIVIAQFIIPQVLHGSSPYLATAIGVMVISFVGIFVTHGLSRRTGLALLSTYISLVVAVGMAFLAVSALHLSGISGEGIFYLGQKLPELNIQGLLLCGMIISLIGILDDITVGQATAVEELHRANPKLSTRELYRRGLRIGREHIASLINTLVLAYAGTSFLFIVYISATSPYPMLVNLNSEIVMEEVVRSIVGSAALILAVPITTILAARFVRTDTKVKKEASVSVPS
jgi:uncharacterized membrane protein